MPGGVGVRYGASMKHMLLAGVVGWALVSGAWAQAPAVFEAYGVGAADPVVLLDLVRVAAGPGSHVTYDERQQRLLVLAPEERQAAIANLLREAAPPPVNVRIEVNFRGSGRESEREASLAGHGEVVYEPGLVHTTVRIEPRVIQAATARSSSVQQVLVVASGREASLRVGEEVPWLEWVLDYGLQHQMLVERVAWQQVGAFLAVQPTVLDQQMIRLRLIPELRGTASDGRPQSVRFAAAATEVVVANGQTYPLAGLAQASEFMSRFLVGRRSLESTEALDISVTPRILP